MAVRIGFLGTGFIATFHSKMLRSCGEDVVWGPAYDPDAEKLQAFCAASGAVAVADEADVLADCDAVYVCTWTSEHERLVAAAAAAGVAVFCEKPLSTDLTGAHRMLERVSRAGVAHQVGLVLRFSPVFAVLGSMLADDVGRVMNVVFRDDQHLPTRGMYGSDWRADVDRAGAGTLLEHSIHDLDLLEMLFGPIADVSARSTNFHGHPGIEDCMVVSFALARGGTGTLTSIWHDIDARPSTRRLEVFCERALFVVEGDWFGPLHRIEADGTTTTFDSASLLEEADRRGLALADPDGAFVRAVRDGRPAWPGLDVAVRAHEVADAVYRAAASGGRVDTSA